MHAGSQRVPSRSVTTALRVRPAETTGASVVATQEAGRGTKKVWTSRDELALRHHPVDPTLTGLDDHRVFHTDYSSTSTSLLWTHALPFPRARGCREEGPAAPTIVIHSNRTGIASNSTRLQAKRDGRKCRLLQLSSGAMMVSANPIPPSLQVSISQRPGLGSRGQARTMERRATSYGPSLPRGYGDGPRMVAVVNIWSGEGPSSPPANGFRG